MYTDTEISNLLKTINAATQCYTCHRNYHSKQALKRHYKTKKHIRNRTKMENITVKNMKRNPKHYMAILTLKRLKHTP